MSANPTEIAARIDARVRAEWPGSRVSTRLEFIAPQIGAGGVTDTLLKLVREIVEDELQRELAGTP